MSVDLKPYFDAVNARADEVQRVAHELDALFTAGTDDDLAKALEMRPELEEAQRRYDESVKLYESMQLANRPNDVAKNFVPVSTTNPLEAEAQAQQPTVIKRAEYDALGLAERGKFIRSGGRVTD